MQDVERYEFLIIGSGQAGKYLTWTMAKAGHRTAMVERKVLGGACPNVACLPSKNLIYSGRVASLLRRGAEFGLEIDSHSVNMAAVQRRKRIMVEGLHQLHVDRVGASGAELIMGEARFVAPRTVEVLLKLAVGESFLATALPSLQVHARQSRYPGTVGGPTGNTRRGSRPRTSSGASDRFGRWLRRPRTGAGHAAIWLASDCDRGRPAARKP